MTDKRPNHHDEIAFWLGMAALLLALCPLAMIVCMINADRWGLSGRLDAAAGLCAMVVAPALGMVLGVASMLVRLNWRGGAGIAVGAGWIIAIVALRAVLGDLPDRYAGV